MRDTISQTGCCCAAASVRDANRLDSDSATRCAKRTWSKARSTLSENEWNRAAQAQLLTTPADSF